MPIRVLVTDLVTDHASLGAVAPQVRDSTSLPSRTIAVQLEPAVSARAPRPSSTAGSKPAVSASTVSHSAPGEAEVSAGGAVPGTVEDGPTGVDGAATAV